MKKIFYFMACCLVAGLFWQCNDDDDNSGDKGPLAFKFPLSEATLPQEGGRKLIEFATTADFTVQVNYDVAPEEGQEWCSVSPLSGSAGRHLMYIELEENPPYDDRYVDIVLSSGGESRRPTRAVSFFRSPFTKSLRTAGKSKSNSKRTAK